MPGMAVDFPASRRHCRQHTVGIGHILVSAVSAARPTQPLNRRCPRRIRGIPWGAAQKSTWGKPGPGAGAPGAHGERDIPVGGAERRSRRIARRSLADLRSGMGCCFWSLLCSSQVLYCAHSTHGHLEAAARVALAFPDIPNTPQSWATRLPARGISHPAWGQASGRQWKPGGRDNRSPNIPHSERRVIRYLRHRNLVSVLRARDADRVVFSSPRR